MVAISVALFLFNLHVVYSVKSPPLAFWQIGLHAKDDLPFFVGNLSPEVSGVRLVVRGR